VPGPRDDWFASFDALLAQPWRVSASSNRVGIRLQGPRLERRIEGELLSEGLVTGSIQVPPAGPILLLNDHPTTGGYPVIGVVVRADLWLAGQLAPGRNVRFDVASLA
jgi:allophanate hydrolase subunit 2